MKLRNKIAIAAVPAFVYLGNNIFDFTKIEIRNKNLSGLKIIHISDFHNRKLGINKKIIFKKVKNFDPDLIFITGDLIDGRKTDIEIALNFVANLKNISSGEIYYVPGNHEKASRVYPDLKMGLEKLGVNIGSYMGEKIFYRESPLTIYGLKDPRFFSIGGYLKDAIYKKKIREMDIDRSSYNILLAHRPEYLDEYSKKGFDLIFSGHAHGGQIRIPFVGGVLAPNQGFCPKLSEGIKQKRNSTMIISRGIGNSIFPVRIFNNPEIIFVEFKWI